jgi:DNA-binding LacI/PurR family transcriptional regulator
VRKVAVELGYQPDAVAQTLARSSKQDGERGFHGTLALAMHPIAAAAVARRAPRPARTWFDAFPETAASLGYKLDLFTLPQTPAEMAAFRRVLGARGIRGVVIDASNQPLLTTGADWENFSVVMVSASSGDQPFHRINSHTSADALTAVRRCQERGYRRPGLVVNAADFVDWAGGFEVTCLQSKIKPAPILNLMEWDDVAFLAWYDRHRPDVIIANQKTRPRATLAAHGVRMPEDVGYCCLDIVSDSSPDISLSGCEQMREVRNRLAVEMVHGALRRGEIGRPEAPLAIDVSPRWHDGETLRAVGSRVVTV